MGRIIRLILATLLLSAIAAEKDPKDQGEIKLFDKIEGEADKLDDKNEKGVGKDIEDLLKDEKENPPKLLKPFIDEIKQNVNDFNVEGIVKNAEEGKKESKEEKTGVLNLSRLVYLYTRLFATQLDSESLKKIADSLFPALDKLEKGKDNYADLVKEIDTETKKAKDAIMKAVKDVYTKLKDEGKKLVEGKKTDKNDRMTIKDLIMKVKNADFLRRGFVADLLGLSGPDTKNPKQLVDKVAVDANKLTKDNEKQLGQEIDKLIDSAKEDTQKISGPAIQELQKEIKEPGTANAIKEAESGKKLSKFQQIKLLNIGRVVYQHVIILANQLQSEELTKIANELKEAIAKVEQGKGDKGELVKEVDNLTKKAKETIKKEWKQLSDKLKGKAKQLEEGKVKADDQNKNMVSKLITKYKEAYYTIRGTIGTLLGINKPHVTS